jgi:hypothetical protein
MTIHILFALALTLFAQHPDMTHRGAQAMGFDQDKTTHHFKLTADGGRIEVSVNNRADQASLAAVRVHLKAIAAEFARGDFSKPFATHGEVPPGVSTMQQRKAMMTFKSQQTPEGGRVTIATSDPDTLAALHAFLRYQITEHRTGDPLTVIAR